MKVSFARKGGWTATLNLRRPPAVLDIDALPQEEREEVKRLIRAAFTHQEQTGDTGKRAAGSYTITVDDGNKQETLSVADAEEEKQPAAAALRQWIEARLPRQ
ncbi:protealysin inhibitor emfourin [Methylobacterium oryzisoli]|uniref:protealysin inhibitor emfourin n=1 Tax=Methylobacterium oryzisoli TaxID=3385502 RepID=UPI0038916801